MTDERHDRAEPWIDETARDLVTVRGADAATYLESQLAQHVSDLVVGERRWTLVLDPTGKVIALAGVARAGADTYHLDVDAGFGDVLMARLARFKIRVDVDLAMQAASCDVPSPTHEQARVVAGWPAMGAEIVPGETIPATTGVIDVAVSFSKGCYPGQELVERMDSRAADAPWVLRLVDVGDGAAVGDAVTDPHGGGEVGTLTSVAPSGTVAIARIRRGHDVGRPPTH